MVKACKIHCWESEVRRGKAHELIHGEFKARLDSESLFQGLKSIPAFQKQRQRQVDLCESEARLAYVMGYSVSRAM